VFFEANKQPKAIIVFSHGFKGFKDWGCWNIVAKQFADAGFVFVKFNFSYNGTTTEKPLDFADLDAFGNNNYTTELNDLGLVIDWALQTELLVGEIDPKQLYLLGHSRGGGISILKAAEDTRVKKLVTWAAVANFVGRMGNYNLAEWKAKGVLYSPNARTKQDMPLYYQLYENTMANAARLDIEKAAEKLIVPFFIIHGSNDEAVPVQDAEILHKKNKTAELLLIDGAGHTFGDKHPFDGSILPEHAQLAVNKTIAFFKRVRQVSSVKRYSYL
jgi:pimeloyl-ACP methyl ester carboxylesterase